MVACQQAVISKLPKHLDLCFILSFWHNSRWIIIWYCIKRFLTSSNWFCYPNWEFFYLAVSHRLEKEPPCCSLSDSTALRKLPLMCKWIIQEVPDGLLGTWGYPLLVPVCAYIPLHSHLLTGVIQVQIDEPLVASITRMFPEIHQDSATSLEVLNHLISHVIVFSA